MSQKLHVYNADHYINRQGGVVIVINQGAILTHPIMFGKEINLQKDPLDIIKVADLKNELRGKDLLVDFYQAGELLPNGQQASNSNQAVKTVTIVQ